MQWPIRSRHHSQVQGLTDYGQRSMCSLPPTTFVNKVLLQHSHVFIHILSLTVFLLVTVENCVAAKETVWPTKPKIFTV